MERIPDWKGGDVSSRPQWDNSRKVTERIFIRGRLRLDTPAGFGNGETVGLMDMALVHDPLDGVTPLLTGSSIAGALRSSLREYDHGFGWAESPESPAKSRAEKLFGHLDDSLVSGRDRRIKGSVYSWLMVDDSLGELPDEGEVIEIRDGVAIDPKTRTAERKSSPKGTGKGKGKKFERELLPAGTIFPLGLELWISTDNERDDLLDALAVALHGLQTGGIGLGARKRRGYGQCGVTDWKVWRYPMNRVDGLLGWLSHTPRSPEAPGCACGDNIMELLGASTPHGHQGESFRIEATFSLLDSLIIRSDIAAEDAPDVRHLHSWRDGSPTPILPGTSLAGALRARALKIARTIRRDIADPMIDDMFGRRIDSREDDPSGSLLLVRETKIEGGSVDRVQSRVKIDRFTGGAYPRALLSEQPLFARMGKEPARVKVDIELRKPVHRDDGSFDAQVGLLLLVLKDLWTGDLPLGGESGIGRGRLQGEMATLTLRESPLEEDDLTWTIEREPDGRLRLGGKGGQTMLEDRFLQALHHIQYPVPRRKETQ